ncbi:MAG: alpha/beta fold hydrolase [Bradymonadia bacterium]
MFKRHFILLLHGGPGLHGYMHTLGDFLPREYAVHCYAQRGSVANPKTLDGLGLNAHFNDIDDIIAKHGQGKSITLIGHSWGAALALLYAAHRRSSVHQVIALGTAPLTLELAHRFEEDLRARLPAQVLSEIDALEQAMKQALADEDASRLNALANRRLALLTPAYHHSHAAHGKLPEVELNFTGFLESQNALWALITAGEIAARLQAVDVPVLSIHGFNDPIPCDETHRLFNTLLPRVHCHTLPQCGHFPWLEPAAQARSVELIEQAIESLDV